MKVTSVQRKEQSLSHSAAAVTVITREDIKRAGFSTIQDALRLAPGLHVGRISTNVWGVGARGFNGQFANKLQVLVDGRSVYMPMNSGVFWNMMDLLLDDVERIEVIRGPGAVMWGANAVTGVINIITRDARETVGTFLELGSGTEDRVLNRVRYGKQIGDNLSFRVSGQYARREHLDSQDNLSGNEPWHSSRSGFRLDWQRPSGGNLTLAADVFRSTLEETYWVPSHNPGVEDTSQAVTETSGQAFQGRWVQDSWRGQRTIQLNYARSYQDRSDYLGGLVHAFDVEYQQRFRLARRHELLAAYGYRSSEDATRGTSRAWFTPERRRYETHGWTVQHEWEIRPTKLFMSSGVRFEESTLGGGNAQPTIRLLWAPLTNLSLWTAVSEARRAPSRVEQDLTMMIHKGGTGLPVKVAKEPNPLFESEKLRAWEGGVRLQTARKISVDASAFRNRYHDLDTFIPGDVYFHKSLGPVLPIHSRNLSTGNAIGAEFSVRADLTYRFRLNGSTTFYRSRLTAPWIHPLQETVPDDFPGRQVQIHGTWDLNRKLQWNSSYYFVGAIPVPTHTQRADTSLRYRFSEWGGFSAGVQNLANSRITELRPGDGLNLQYARRRLWVRMQWWF